MGTQYIYSRVSTDLQTTLNQVSRLKELYPNAIVIEETASGGRHRPKLECLLSEVASGDELIVSSLDRLGRRASEILVLIETLDKKGVTLKSLRENIDFSTTAGRLIFQVMAAVSEMERRLISERTKSALQAKRKLGVVGGRRRQFDEALIARAQELRNLSRPLKYISEATGISIPRLSQITKPKR